jgi:hypothetical protein
MRSHQTEAVMACQQDYRINQPGELIMKSFQKANEETALPRSHPAHEHQPPFQAMTNRQSGVRGSGFKRFIKMLDNNVWMLSAMILAVTALILGWWIVSGQGPGGTKLVDKPLETSPQTNSTASQAIDELDNRLASLVKRAEMLTDSITYLESKLVRAHVLADSIITAGQRVSSLPPQQPATAESAPFVDRLPPSAAGQAARLAPAEFTAVPRETTANSAAVATTDAATSRQPEKVLHGTLAPATDRVAGAQSNTARIMQDATHAVAVAQSREPVPKHQTPANASKAGPWVVNLTSSPSQADADRFAATARSRGIETQQQQITLGGNRYWRVQTTGFSTADEAQRYAGMVREELGLRDLWITRR